MSLIYVLLTPVLTFYSCLCGAYFCYACGAKSHFGRCNFKPSCNVCNAEHYGDRCGAVVYNLCWGCGEELRGNEDHEGKCTEPFHHEPKFNRLDPTDSYLDFDIEAKLYPGGCDHWDQMAYWVDPALQPTTTCEYCGARFSFYECLNCFNLFCNRCYVRDDWHTETANEKAVKLAREREREREQEGGE